MNTKDISKKLNHLQKLCYPKDFLFNLTYDSWHWTVSLRIENKDLVYIRNKNEDVAFTKAYNEAHEKLTDLGNKEIIFANKKTKGLKEYLKKCSFVNEERRYLIKNNLSLFEYNQRLKDTKVSHTFMQVERGFDFQCGPVLLKSNDSNIYFYCNIIEEALK